MTVVIASAPGKINLALLVGEPSADGYHPLTSVFEAVSLREYVVVEDVTGQGGPAGRQGAGVDVKTLLYSQDAAGGGLVFDPRATADFAEFDGPGHLAARAAALLSLEGQLLRITVHKSLPVAGGMAGGSADAAATLVAMNELNGLGHSAADLASLGATLGADVPACVVGGLALGLGRGDRMEPLASGSQAPTVDSRWWVVAFAKVGLSTPQVFRAFDEKLKAGPEVSLRETGGFGSSGGSRGGPESRDFGGRSGRSGRATGDSGAGGLDDSVPGVSMSVSRLQGLQLPGSEVGVWLVNDLEPTVFEMRPELLEVGSVMRSLGAQAWMLSGSGPTIVGLAPTQEDAADIAEGVALLPQVRGSAVVWGPGVSAKVERSLPPWVTAGRSPGAVPKRERLSGDQR